MHTNTTSAASRQPVTPALEAGHPWRQAEQVNALQLEAELEPRDKRLWYDGELDVEVDERRLIAHEPHAPVANSGDKQLQQIRSLFSVTCLQLINRSSCALQLPLLGIRVT